MTTGNKLRSISGFEYSIPYTILCECGPTMHPMLRLKPRLRLRWRPRVFRLRLSLRLKLGLRNRTPEEAEVLA